VVTIFFFYFFVNFGMKWEIMFLGCLFLGISFVGLNSNIINITCRVIMTLGCDGWVSTVVAEGFWGILNVWGRNMNSCGDFVLIWGDLGPIVGVLDSVMVL
jgi:hypothetical protein